MCHSWKLGFRAVVLLGRYSFELDHCLNLVSSLFLVGYWDEFDILTYQSLILFQAAFIAVLFLLSLSFSLFFLSPYSCLFPFSSYTIPSSLHWQLPSNPAASSCLPLFSYWRWIRAAIPYEKILVSCFTCITLISFFVYTISFCYVTRAYYTLAL